ncbi:selenocysteine-specific translation elongation factor [Alkalibacillus haloalkaliphilus]|uniref:Selenocysteine-specific elongation factor n=1 Tax=Alkalibacillus haloalkaliphilus TaxID=94136 RepID=A0A511W202_9BACI|nr:selenocysteine-specific translation elongation factor [Alkalibacillus haloalkaliphilus]GEN45017.1 selenocysteine-specific translation elongation factor [Alkalibacillus haloalkaliphilus]
MTKSNYTIGMAGHIDHGKSELTKALTGVETDRLKEEQERKISIELGYAPLYADQEYSLSIIDVPGHEKFIRQMIAGVSGVDHTLLIIAADEGVMPQTVEHIEILNYLEINRAYIVITKVDLVEEELLQLVKDDINHHIKNTIFENVPIYCVDSISGNGIDLLKTDLITALKRMPEKDHSGFFRMPVDQAFHVHGIGTVVRGTIVEGSISEREQIAVKPQDINTEAKSLQQFGQTVSEARAGTRTAIALKGVDYHSVKRGDVLTTNSHEASNRIDLKLHISPNLNKAIKQRSPIKFHTGTSEVHGRIILFDRNEIESANEEVYAQVELDHTVYATRHDFFILRRATPMETIGGGRIINAPAKRHRFGTNTVKLLKQQSELTIDEAIIEYIEGNGVVKKKEVVNELAIDPTEGHERLNTLYELDKIYFINDLIMTRNWLNQYVQLLNTELTNYHNHFSLRQGYPKAEFVQLLPIKAKTGKVIVDHLVEEGHFRQINNNIALPSFSPFIDDALKQDVELGLTKLQQDALHVEKFSNYFPTIGQDTILDLQHYLTNTNQIVQLSEELIVSHETFHNALDQLRKETTDQFTLKEAKDVLSLSRKYLIPLLEKLDEFEYTKRLDNARQWNNQ